ncbi:MAG: type II toxin-antitoxin system RelE/ParE family toxin [Bacteroidetes bacterium]|nr:MAG: type II toxin-antitoxin system RelE/ParE family toxin [Bacteroidota bacterium]
MNIEYHPAIEGELKDIIDYYNRCSAGLGTEFLDEFEQHVSKISLMPTRWMVIENDIRRSLMKRFPYVIYFRALENNLLRITVVKHQRKHPRYGKRRK